MSFLGKSWCDWHCWLFGHAVPDEWQYPGHYDGNHWYAKEDVECTRCGKMFGKHERTR